MLNKHISGPKMDPSETRKGQSFQELNEVPILVLYFLIFSFLSSCIWVLEICSKTVCTYIFAINKPWDAHTNTSDTSVSKVPNDLLLSLQNFYFSIMATKPCWTIKPVLNLHWQMKKFLSKKHIWLNKELSNIFEILCKMLTSLWLSLQFLTLSYRSGLYETFYHKKNSTLNGSLKGKCRKSAYNSAFSFTILFTFLCCLRSIKIPYFFERFILAYCFKTKWWLGKAFLIAIILGRFLYFSVL